MMLDELYSLLDKNQKYFSYAFVCNVLPVILRANFADPVDSVQDIIDRNMTILYPPFRHSWRDWWAGHYNPDYQKLSKTMIIGKLDTFYEVYLRQGMLRDNRLVYVSAFMDPTDPVIKAARWWRSKEMMEGFQGFSGFISSKQWKFNEVKHGSNFP